MILGGFLGSLNTNVTFKMFLEVPGAQGAQIGRHLLDSNHETVNDSRMTQESERMDGDTF